MLFSYIFTTTLLASPILAAPSRTLNRRAENPWEVIPPTPELPGNVEGQFAKINGIALWYAEFGTRTDTSLPVVMLHGLFGSSNWFGSVIERLMANHYVIALDSRAQGRSTMGSAPFTQDLLASDTAVLLERLNVTKAAYVGWSDGADTTLRTLKTPAIASLVERAYLFGGTYNTSANNATFIDSAARREFVARASAEYLQFHPNGNLTELYAFLNSKPGIEYSLEDLSTLTIGDKLTVAGADYEEAVNLNVPAIVQGAIKGSKMVILTNVSHFAPVQDPDQFTASLEEFLAA